MKTQNTLLTRREFARASLLGAGALAWPAIIPARLLGADAPSKKINILQIGCGRIGRSMDLPGILAQDRARIVAVCDLDSIRVADAKRFVEEAYAKKNVRQQVATYADYREALQRADIDAVAISTPDHWHAQPIIEAALAGKDIYVQKPLTMTLREGRAVSDLVRAKQRAFQIGSQQRSGAKFRLACELVRNGRLGRLHTVRIGLPTDPAGAVEPDMPVPPNLNYDRWLGPTPVMPYTENRVHSQSAEAKKRYGDRPGWLRIESYCLGMITGWGSHHVDIAHWGMGAEHTGPVAIEARAEFPKSGLWNVHGAYHIESRYASGVTVIIDNTFPNGIRFEGADGWLFVTRDSGRATAADPATGMSKALNASKADIVTTPLGAKELRLHASENNDHHRDWINSILSRKPAVTTPEIAHRSTSACILGWIGMKLGRKLTWDPQKETFVGEDAANALLTRTERAPYGGLAAARAARVA
ncbi:MAG: Gfo/Idh/MocA family oxidoreductase [Verrucomicrobia bacterium]|nr:Gfo/Idh/MocA family oxidoreductase [Verrucomicrobiota bacterium]